MSTVKSLEKKFLRLFDYDCIQRNSLWEKKYDLFKAYKNWDKSNHRVGFQRFPANPLDKRTGLFKFFTYINYKI
jgi:hypothetical protein